MKLAMPGLGKVRGLENGYSLMVGGSTVAVALIEPAGEPGS